MDDHFYDEEDLVTANPSDRNWKGIIIAVLVITTVLALIVTSVVLLTPPDEGPRVKGKRFELNDIFKSEFQPLRNNGSWISDTELVFGDIWGGVSVLNIKDNGVRSLVSNYTLRRFDAKLAGVSRDLKYAVLVYDSKPIHRHSTESKYIVFDVATQDFHYLNTGNREDEGRSLDLQLAIWSPADQGMAFVHSGDIYYKSSPNGTTLRLTNTAVPGVIFNGVPDWLYEEEILESNTALWFSEDGKNLLYLTINDSLVGEHPIVQYGSAENPHIYPQMKSLRYPKPGTNNPVVKASVVDLRQPNNPRTLSPPRVIADGDHYITSCGWANNREVAIIWTTRNYHLSIITLCNAAKGSCEEVYRVTTEKRGWVDTVGMPVFSSKSRNFITIAPIRDGENGYFDHLVLVDTANKRSHPITHGNMDVVKISAWDEERNLIYFLAVSAKQPQERRFYRLKVESPYTEHKPECLSCSEDNLPRGSHKANEFKTNATSGGNDHTVYTHKPKTGDGGINKQHNKGKKVSSFGMNTGGSLSQTFKPDYEDDALVLGADEGRVKLENNINNSSNSTLPPPPPAPKGLFGSHKPCTYVSGVKFSKNKSYFTLECSGRDIPFVVLCSTDTKIPTILMTIQNNDALRNRSAGMAFPQVEIFELNLNSGHTVQVKLLLPPGLRKDEVTKYPLLLNVYGGPGTQLATDRWGVDFGTYLASSKDYIVLQVDSRGSGGKGWDFQHKVYYKLGMLEAEDQIEIVKDLKNALHFVDGRKIGIWGWSYGGYLTSMIMASKESKDLFHCGASIAPVTNWKLYDSAYTERYMGKPEVTENYRGYFDSDVTHNVDNFQNKMFYLLHGTADDNVHIQHSMLLSKALIDKNIMFRQQIYPDESHSLRGVQHHVHLSLEEYFEDCFKKQADLEQKEILRNKYLDSESDDKK